MHGENNIKFKFTCFKTQPIFGVFWTDIRTPNKWCCTVLLMDIFTEGMLFFTILTFLHLRHKTCNHCRQLLQRKHAQQQRHNLILKTCFSSESNLSLHIHLSISPVLKPQPELQHTHTESSSIMATQATKTAWKLRFLQWQPWDITCNSSRHSHTRYEVRTKCFQTDHVEHWPNMMQSCITTYYHVNWLWISVETVFVTEHCFLCNWCLSVFVVCSVIPIKWQTLRNRECAPRFVSTLTKEVLSLRVAQKAFRDDTMSINQSSKWYLCFKSGETSIEELEHLGYHQVGLMAKWKKCVKSSMRTDSAWWMMYVTFRPITQYVWCTLSEDVNMRQIAAKFVPCLLNDNQKQKQLSECRNLWDRPKCQPSPLDFLDFWPLKMGSIGCPGTLV